MTIIVGLALTAALWAGGPGAALADDVHGQGSCDPVQPFVPGTSLGPVRIGMPLDAVQRWYGRPRAVETRLLQGHQWTHMQFSGVDVLARDNTVVGLNALNLSQFSPGPLQTTCGTPLARPYSLPVGYVQQTYGWPSSTTIVNGLQYWLYNTLGLLFTVPLGGQYVQGLTVYQAGQYCAVVPAFTTFGGFVFNAGSRITAQCPRDPGDRER